MRRYSIKIIAFALIPFVFCSYQIFKYSPFNKMVYKPFCYENGTRYLNGPLRPEFKEEIIYYLKQENFHIWEEDSELYVTLIQLNEGNEIFSDRNDFLENTQSKLILTTLNRIPNLYGEIIEPPKALIEAANQIKFENNIPLNQDLPLKFRHECRLTRAGAIWVEKLGSDGDLSQNP